MGTVSTYSFTSDTETVTRVKLNNLVANLLTEFNGQIDNDNIKAGAGISASKIDLASPGTIGATTPAAATFTTVTAATVTITGGAGVVPLGGIIEWSGAVVDIPTGWGLCDGSTYGTVVSPDLTDTFIIGAGGTFSPGDTGGSTTIAEANLPAHTHGAGTLATNTTGAHTHNYDRGVLQSESDGLSQAMKSYSSTATSSAGDHSHTISGNTGSSGSGTAYYQPYYALAKIIKHDG